MQLCQTMYFDQKDKMCITFNSKDKTCNDKTDQGFKEY